MNVCDCNGTLKNTGNDCLPVMNPGDKLVAVPLKASDGTRNSILLSATFDQAYFDARINETDPTKRWYPLQSMKNVLDERADSIKETFEDQSMQFVQQGVGSVTALISEGDGANQVLLGKYKSFKCRDFGFFIISITGDLTGTIGNSQSDCEPTELYPIQVDRGSWDPRLRKKTNTTGQAIMIMFNWAITEQDENLRTITASEANYDLAQLEGLKDVCAIISDIDNTTFTAELRITGFGNLTAPITVEGLVAADFALYNVTDASPVTILTVTETDGSYVFTFATQTNGDILRLTPTETGYDFTAVIAEQIQMPLT